MREGQIPTNKPQTVVAAVDVGDGKKQITTKVEGLSELIAFSQQSKPAVRAEVVTAFKREENPRRRTSRKRT